MAAAIAANIQTANALAEVGPGVTLKAGAETKVTSLAHTDAKASADGSQVNNGGTAAGIGAAVALNVGVSNNRALLRDNSTVDANGVVVSATMAAGETNEFGADAKSGAGAAKVGLAGALATSVAVNTTQALVEGDQDKSGSGATVKAGTGDLLISASNATSNVVTAGAEVEVTPPAGGTSGGGTSGSTGTGTSTASGSTGTGGAGSSSGGGVTKREMLRFKRRPNRTGTDVLPARTWLQRPSPGPVVARWRWLVRWPWSSMKMKPALRSMKGHRSVLRPHRWAM